MSCLILIIFSGVFNFQHWSFNISCSTPKYKHVLFLLFFVMLINLFQNNVSFVWFNYSFHNSFLWYGTVLILNGSIFCLRWKYQCFFKNKNPEVDWCVSSFYLLSTPFIEFSNQYRKTQPDIFYLTLQNAGFEASSKEFQAMK